MPELTIPTTKTLIGFLLDVLDHRVRDHADDLGPHLHLDDGTYSDVSVMTEAAHRAGLVDQHPESTWWHLTDAGHALLDEDAPLVVATGEGLLS